MSESLQAFRQTQSGTVILWATSIGAAFPTYALTRPGASDDPVVVVLCVGILLILVATAVCFASLTVAVTRDHVELTFGIGWIRRTIPLADVREVHVGRSPRLAGWGIRLTPDGTLYNVSGSGVVRLALRDGTTTMVGSAEPDVLAHAIRERLRDLAARGDVPPAA
jgi:hypothetical protein